MRTERPIDCRGVQNLITKTVINKLFELQNLMLKEDVQWATKLAETLCPQGPL